MRIAIAYDPDEDEGSWVLTEPYTRETLIGPITVPAGFRTDLASVPWQLVWKSMFRQFGKWGGAAVVHDYLYRTKPPGVTKEEADLVFLDLLTQDGMNLLQRTAMYRAVDNFGGRAWRSHSKKA